MEPELKLERVRFRVWNGEALRARGDAQSITIRRDTNLAVASDLRAEMPARDKPVFLTAPRAQGDLSTQVFTAEGGVTVTHAGERATTERARYEPGPTGQGFVSGQDPVVLVRKGLRTAGTGFTFEPQTGELQLGGPVDTQAGGDR